MKEDFSILFFELNAGAMDFGKLSAAQQKELEATLQRKQVGGRGRVGVCG